MHPENSFGISPGIPEFEYIKNIFFVGGGYSIKNNGNVRYRCLCLLEQGYMLRHHIQLFSMHAGEAGTGSVSFPHVQIFRTNLDACSQKVLGNRGGTRKYAAKSNVHPEEIHDAESSKRFLQ